MALDPDTEERMTKLVARRKAALAESPPDWQTADWCRARMDAELDARPREMDDELAELLSSEGGRHRATEDEHA